MGKQIVGATTAAGIDWSELKGKLLIFEPLDFEQDIKTVHGDADAVRANVYAITATGKATSEHEDTLVFPKVLVSQLRRKIGSYVVGVLAQGSPKKGQSAPWLLAEPNAKHLAAAGKFLAAASVAEEEESTEDDFEDDEDGF
jgi:hypothetical protein